MMIGIGAGVDQGFGLLVERVADLGFREIAVGFHQAAEGADVADDVAVLAAERFADDGDGRLIDFDDAIGVAMPVEHDARAAEGVGEDAIGAGVGVAALDGKHLLRMRQVPFLAAVALREAGEHELRAHRPVAQQGALADRFQQWLFHVRFFPE